MAKNSDEAAVDSKLTWKRRHVVVRLLIAMCAIALGAPALSILSTVASIAPAVADFQQSDGDGYFNIDFKNSQAGIAADGPPWRSNINVNTSAGTAGLTTAATSGYFTTGEIRPLSFRAWDKVEITANVSDARDMKVSVYDCSAVPTPVAALQNLTATGGIVDISSLSAASYPCLRVKVDLATNGPVRPVIDNLRVSWDELPVFLVAHSGTPTSPVGTKLDYQVKYSVNYSDEDGVVVWVPLPQIDRATVTDFTAAYSQTPNPTFVAATDGGIHTAAGTTLYGVTIPANSVYWDLGKVKSGTTAILSYQLNTLNGWQNSITYKLQASIDGVKAEPVVSDADKAVAGAQPVKTVLTSKPVPKLTKRVSGAIRISGTNYVLNAGQYTTTVTYTVTGENGFAPTGRETIFNPIYTDDLTDIYAKLVANCGVAAGSEVARITPNMGATISGTTITWPVQPHLGPGGSQTVNFQVNYSGCSDATIIDNIGHLDADNIDLMSDPEPVRIGIDLSVPSGIFAKGDKVAGAASIAAGLDDNPLALQYSGDVYSYLLQINNTAAVRVQNIVMVDKVPAGTTFLSASLPPAANGTVRYYPAVSASADSDGPDFDEATGAFSGSVWTTTAPTDPSLVTWVAFSVPCANSPFFPAPTGSACATSPTSVVGEMQVRLNPPAVCNAFDVVNKGNFFAYRASNSVLNADANVVTLATPLSFIGDPEPTHVGPKLAKLQTSISGPAALVALQTGEYTIKIANSGADTAAASELSIPMPTVDINGVATRVPFVSASVDGGGSVDVTGLPNTVKVVMGDLAPGSSRTVKLLLKAPKGMISGFTLAAQARGDDPEGCQDIVGAGTTSSSFGGTPEVQIVKSRDEAIIGTGSVGDPIHYQVRYENVGDGPSTGTYILDAIPRDTTFLEAYTSATDDHGTTYTCAGCKVFFADRRPELPPDLSATEPIDPSLIAQYFTPGVEGPAGVWKLPAGLNPWYVAWLVDNPALKPAHLPVDTAGLIGMKVRNDANNYGTGTTGEPSGTIIYNYPGVVSNELLQAIGRQVITTILPDPGLRIDKRSNVEVVSATEEVDWIIDYYNDSTNPTTTATLSDQLPSTVEFVRLEHEWNAAARAAGKPAGRTNITTNANVTRTANPAGDRIDVDLIGLRAGDLQITEGGSFHVIVKVRATTPSNLVIYNTATGCYSAGPDEFCTTDEDEVRVENPDLWVRKQASMSDPVAGQTLQYTLLIQNMGEHAAPGVKVIDTLPAGLCYVGPTTISPAGWTIPAPTVSGACGSAQTLTWNNNIDHTATPVGTIAGRSELIAITYAVQVKAGTAPNTSLVNNVVVSTTLPEDAEYANTNNEIVVTPRPDPYVSKAAPTIVQPGEPFEYTISYGNTARETALDVVVVDTLPNVKLVSVSGSSGEAFFYNTSASPTPFAVASPTANGWSTSLIGARSIAIVAGTLGAFVGPRNVTVTAAATDGTTGAPLGAGATVTNRAVVTSATVDANAANNNASVETSTPGTDLSIEKTSDPEGIFPGAAPGDSITYTIKYRNLGTVPACAVFVTDTLPAGVVPADPVHNFAEVVVTDLAGNQVKVLKPSGASYTAITGTVGVTFTTTGPGAYRWELGSADTVANANVCLPPKSQGSFQIRAKLANDLADSTVQTNTATVGEDSTAVELITGNNTDTATIGVYRADLVVTKSGVALGTDNAVGGSGAAADDENFVDAGERIRYTIGYDNVGHRSAESAKITETIPFGTCYRVGTVETSLPDGANVQYSNDDGSSWTYTPISTGGIDCNVTGFRLAFDPPVPAPATFWSQTTQADFAANTFTGTANGAFAKDAVTFPFAAVALSPTANMPTARVMAASEGVYYVAWIQVGPDASKDVYLWDSVTQTAVNLSTSPARFGDADQLAMVATPGGGMALAFREIDAVSGEYAVYLADETGSVTNLSATMATAASSAANNFKLAAGPDGNAWVVWTQPVTGETASDVHVYDTGGVVTGAVDVSSAIPGGDNPNAASATGLTLVVHSQSNEAFVVWGEGKGTSTNYREWTWRGSTGAVAELSSVEATSPVTYVYEKPGSGIVTGWYNGGFYFRDPADAAPVTITSRVSGFGGSFGATYQVRGVNGVLHVAYGYFDYGSPAWSTGYWNSSARVNVNLKTRTSAAVAYATRLEVHPTLGAQVFFATGYTWTLWQYSAATDTLTSHGPVNLSYGAENEIQTFRSPSGKVSVAWDSGAKGLDVETGPFTPGGITPVGFSDGEYGWFGSNASAKWQASYSKTGSILTFGSNTAGVPAPFLGLDGTHYISSSNSAGTDTVFWNLDAGGQVAPNNTAFPAYQPSVLAGAPKQAAVHDSHGYLATWSESNNKLYAAPVALPSGTVVSPAIDQTPFGAGTNLLGWGVLYYSGVVPDGAGLTIDILDGVSATAISGFTGIKVTGSGKVDVAGIDPALHPKLKLRANFTNSTTNPFNTPVLKDWTVTMVTDRKPSFTFDVQVKSGVALQTTTIDNSVAISTTTPEISTTNNQDTDRLNVVTADVAIDKVVDKAAINLIEAAGTTVMTYTLKYRNNGPNPATGVTITDSLPAAVDTVVSVTKPASSAGQIPTCPAASGTPKVLTCTLPSLAVNESGEIVIAVALNETTIIVGDALANTVAVSSATHDIDFTNNSDAAVTAVGDLANLWVTKSGPKLTSPNETFDYTVTYGNNGNLAAAAATVTDTLSVDTVFVSATSSGPIGSCNHATGIVTCGGTSATLAAGATGAVTITVRVKNDVTLITAAKTLTNRVAIATTTPQSNISDDAARHDVPVLLGALSSLSGRVFLDIDNDVVFDSPAESGIDNVTIRLTGKDIFGRTVEITTTTDNRGDYSFGGLVPGTYNVTEDQPAGYRSTGSNGGSLQLDAAGTPIATPAKDGKGSKEDASLSVDEVKSIVLEAGENSTQNNFGEVAGQIGNLVFFDSDGDGRFRPTDGETGIPGVQMTLFLDNGDGVFSSADQPLSVVATDNDGRYLFADQLLDRVYFVVPTDGDNKLTGLLHTVGAGRTDEDSQAATGYKIELTAAAPSNLTADFGYLPGSVGDVVWFDDDGDGLYEPADGEICVNGVMVTLTLPGPDGDLATTADNTARTTATTNGVYLFDNLPAGSYRVTVDPLSTPIASLANSGDPDGTKDNTTVVVLAAGVDYVAADFGYMGGRVGNQVWINDDGDGVFEGGTETGIAGVVIDLFRDLTGNGLTADDLRIGARITNGTGQYLFSRLSVDDGGGDAMYIALVANDDATNQGPAPLGASASGDNNNKNIAGYSMKLTPAAPENLTADFGYQRASLGNFVWDDNVVNGLQGSDPGHNGVVVRLLDSNSNVIAETMTVNNPTSGASGWYLFSNLDGGDYFVEFVVPTGFTMTTRNAGTDRALDSDPLPTIGRTARITLASGEANLTVDAGLVPDPLAEGSIGDFIFSDITNNGRFDSAAGDTPVPNGVVVNLRSLATGAELKTMTTTNGRYLFTGLAPGDYFVEVPASEFAVGGRLAGWIPSTLIEPNANLDRDEATDQHAYKSATLVGSVVSRPLTISWAGRPSVGAEPLNDDPANIDSTQDDLSNLMLDLGLVPPSAITLVKSINGVDADTAPGVTVVAGSTLSFTYLVTNAGLTVLTGLTVSDDRGVVVTCPGSGTLLPGASVTCTGSTVAPIGQYTNVGTAQAATPIGTTVRADEPANAFGAVAKVDIEKYVNGFDADTAPGPYLPLGSTVNWTYVVTNTGNTPLASVVVTDNKGVAVTCPRATLAPSATMTCTGSGVVTTGPYTNIGTVTATPVNTVGGAIAGATTVTDTDAANHVAALPGIDVEKHVAATSVPFVSADDADTATGPFIVVGGTAYWTYTVTNSGNVALTNVVITDSQLGVIACGPGALAVGETRTCAPQSTPVSAGQSSTGVNAVGTDPNGQTVGDADPVHHFGTSPAVQIVKSTNGTDANAAPGPHVPVGGSITWTYVVTNTGNIALASLAVTDDDVAVTVDCDGVTTLAVGESVTCTATGLATTGQYNNVGTVRGTPVNSAGTPITGLPAVSADDASHYFGVMSALTIVKSTNGQDANASPGPYLAVGASVTWSYLVTNIGNVRLTNVFVTDDQFVSVSCPTSTLNPGQSTTCTGTGVAAAGQYSNVGTASGQPSATDATPLSGFAPITSADPSHYFGATPSVSIVKSVNGDDANTKPGITVLQGATLAFTYLVTNTGNVALTGVAVADDQGIAVACPDSTLAVNATMTCTGSVSATSGQYTNIGTVIATSPLGTSVTDDDSANAFGADPAIVVKKYVNGFDADAPQGPYLADGAAIVWTYVVTNTGNVPLKNVVVTDDKGVTVSCPSAAIAVGDELACTGSGTATPGQYVNTATAIGTPTAHNGAAIPGATPVGDTDQAHHFGAVPGIDVEKHVAAAPAPFASANDADSAPGVSIGVGGTAYWTYVVTNSGNAPLSNVVVTDSVLGVISCGVGTLNPGSSRTCALTSVPVAEGLTVSGVHATAIDPLGQIVGDADPAHHFGAAAAVAIEKSVNGQPADTTPGPAVTPGSAVTWVYKVSNTGNVTLKDVTVADDDPAVVVDCGAITTLAVGRTLSCTASGTAVAGQYRNIGSVSGLPVDSNGDPIPGTTAVTDLDPANYLGATPSVSIGKTTNGQDADTAPGVHVLPGSVVTWRYTVRNTGNVPLSPVWVLDDRGEDVTCPRTTLTAGRSMVCLATGTALVGQYSNTGTVTGQPTDFDLNPLDGVAEVADDDPSNYFGVVPGINLVKSTNGLDADTAPGAYIPVGGGVAWTYDVTNTGNVTLATIAVTDDRGVAVACPSATLAPNATMSCSGTGTAVAGQYTNVGKVVGTPADASGSPLGATFPSVTTTEPSNYFGVDARLKLVKYTLGTDNDTTTGPYVPEGSTVAWTYEVTNIGNVALDRLVVSDDQGVSVTCPITTMAPNITVRCSGSGPATVGQYANLGTATARAVEADGDPMIDAVTGLGFNPKDDNADHYFGARPANAVVKKVNGADANTAPGPYLTVGSTVQWTYDVTNTGNVVLNPVSVVDDQGVAVTCPSSRLVVAATMTCTGSGTVVDHHYVNVGTASGTPVDGSGNVVVDPTTSKPMPPATAADPAHYTGDAPKIEILYEVCTGGTGCDPGTPTDWVKTTPTVVGEPVQYQLTVTNTGTSPLTQVGVMNPEVIECESVLAGALEVGDTWSYTCDDLTGGGAKASLSSVSGVSPTGLVARASSDASVTPPADLVIAKSVDRPAPVPGSRLVYTLAVGNSGGSAAQSAVVVDTLPKALSYVMGSGNPAPTWDAALRTLTWNIGTVEPGEVVTITYATDVARDASGSIVNKAQVASVGNNAVEASVANNNVDREVVVHRGLPVTGASIGRYLQLGVLLIAVGLALVFRRRRTK
jgi:large repetitive protein